MVKISTFIIGLLTISLFIGTFVYFMGGLTEEYNINYDNSTALTFQQMEDLTDQIDEIKNETLQAKQTTGVLDQIGALFGSGLDVLLITAKSISVFDTMTNEVVDQSNLGGAGTLFKKYILAVVLVLIIIGVIVGAIIKRDT